MHKPTLSIIIVTRNGLEDLKICLPSILTQSYRDFEVCIIDNNSSDKSQDYIRSLNDQRLFSIVLDKNYGFALPNNIWLKNTIGKYILALNNDIELEPNFLEQAVTYLASSDDKTYAINPKMVYYFDRESINTIWIDITKNGNGYNIAKGESVFEHNSIKQIFWVCGGAAFYKRDIIEKLGYLFDSDYFAYLEDLDLAIRAHLAWYKAYYLPLAVCYHKHSTTSQRLSFKKYHLIETNRLRNLIKYYPRYYVFSEPLQTLRVFLKSNKQGRLDQKQKKILSWKNIGSLLRVLIASRWRILIEIWHLLKLRKAILWNSILN